MDEKSNLYKIDHRQTLYTQPGGTDGLSAPCHLSGQDKGVEAEKRR